MNTTMTQLIEIEIEIQEEEEYAEEAAKCAAAETVWNTLTNSEQSLCKATESPFLNLNAVYDFFLKRNL